MGASMVWHRLRFPLLGLWLVILILAVPRALHVGHGLSGSGLDDPRSAATWADRELGRIGAGVHDAPAAPLSTLVEGLPLSRVRADWGSVAAGTASGHPAAADITALPGHPDDVVVDVLPGPAAEAAAGAFARSLAGRPGVDLQAVTMDSAGGGVLSSAMTTLKVSARVALPLLALLLFLVYDSVLAAALPLVVALVGAVVALAAVDLLEPYMQLSAYLTNIVSFLALGVGIDYSLFLSSRFRAALRRAGGAPAAVPAALAEAMRTSGVSVFFSALAVGASMLALLLPRTPYWSGLAVGGCAAVLAVLLATLTLLPALLAVLGPRAEWGRIPRPEWLGRFWPAVASAVTRRPLWAFALGVALLAAPALWSRGLQVHTPADVAKMLAPTDPARLTVEQQQRDYGAGSIAPLPVVLRAPGSLSSVSTWDEVAEVGARLAALPAARSVASPAAGAPPAALAAAFSAPGGPPAALGAATGRPDLIALQVTSRYGPDSPRTAALLAQVDAILAGLPAGWRGAVGGPVALLRSFNDLVARTLPAMVAVVAGVALVVLFAASGSLPVAVLAVLFDGLVALATAGILVFAVQGGRFGFEALPLDASITPLIFVILFGLSMDYEVILIHRIREHAGPAGAREAARRGLAETGGMITGAGLLMVVAFAALLLSPLQLMRTLALGLAIAILLDTWIVRAVLVPASVALLGRGAWWPWGARGGR
jgi:uncharacterized membrane protein YdfJ with MMPL/SSD domain